MTKEEILKEVEDLLGEKGLQYVSNLIEREGGTKSAEAYLKGAKEALSFFRPKRKVKQKKIRRFEEAEVLDREPEYELRETITLTTHVPERIVNARFVQAGPQRKNKTRK